MAAPAATSVPFDFAGFFVPDRFTAVRCRHGDGLRHEIVFGRSFFDMPFAKRRLTIRYFESGEVFAYIRQTPAPGNRHDPFALYFGEERLIIVRAVQHGKPCQPIDGVKPGGEILLCANGPAQIQRVRRIIRDIDASGIDPADVSPADWRIVHKRLKTHRTDLSCKRRRRRLFLLRRRIGR